MIKHGEMQTGAVRPDPSLRKRSLLGMTLKLTHYQLAGCAERI
jgi:hypothetical protein